MQDWLFYHHHLERVSRSFSFCIAQLPSPQREWISLSYLLFRIADTIEDSKWPTQNNQFDKFNLLKQALDLPSSPAELTKLQNNFPDGLAKGEILLIADLPILLNDFFALAPPQQNQLRKNITQMIDGMMYFLKHHQENGELVFNLGNQLNLALPLE